MTSDKERTPVRPRYGRVPGFGKPFKIEPGACPTCGAYPPCEVSSSLTNDERRAYQAMTSRGVDECDAVSAALDGVDIDDVRDQL